MASLCDRLSEDPAAILHTPYDECFALSKQELHDVHLAGVRKRFSDLRGRLKALDRLAEEQGVDEIRTLDDVVPLLLPHTAYKSYPLNFLERNRFDALTKWLGGMCVTDLSGVDAKGVESIDDWLRLLDDTTPMMVHHTFGTTGKLSFIPRTKREWRNTLTLSGNSLRDWDGPGTGPDLVNHHLPVVASTYRKGFSTTARSLDLMVEMFAGGDDNALFLYPEGYVSADVASLAGRLRAAEARGEEGRLQLAPTLLARREEFARIERNRPAAMRDFLHEVKDRFGGQDVYLFGFWPVISDWAEEALSQGISQVFGPGSVFVTGGGTKGRAMPDRWRERIFEFLGFERVFNTFGMSEMSAGCSCCKVGNYHFPPAVVPFVLDVEAGAPSPRAGRQTGRLAVMDLLCDTYWGGLVTGDLVTVGGWDEPCACGRAGPYLEPDIRRIADLQGGEDKINCAGAPAAHDRAMDFIVAQSAA